MLPEILPIALTATNLQTPELDIAESDFITKGTTSGEWRRTSRPAAWRPGATATD